MYTVSYTIVNPLLLLRIYNDIMKKSCEQRLITKDHIAMHTRSALYSSALVINFLNVRSSRKLFLSSQK